MVTYKGFIINIASQIDAHPLPEFSIAHGLGASSTVACYIPIYPGAQIWVEYFVDRPQPPEAIYLFKLFISGQFVTSWDCTSEYGFKGKTLYSLHSAKYGNFTGSTVGQCSFQYNNQDIDGSPNTRDNCIEIRVHRVRARRRIRGPVDVPAPKSLLVAPNAIKLCDSGYIDQYQPARRYQYLLVDAQDEPFATFRFYCRSIDYLERHGILDMRSTSPTSMATSSSQYLDIDTSPPKGTPDTSERAKAVIDEDSGSENLDRPMQRPYLPRSQSCGSNSIIKDSIEDLPSMVARMIHTSTSYSPTNKRASLGSDHMFGFSSDSPLPPPSPTKASSPLIPPIEALRIRKRTCGRPPIFPHNAPIHQKEHGVNALPTNTNLTVSQPVEDPRSSSVASARSVSRPLSPFTSGGFLRRLISHGNISPNKNLCGEGQARQASSSQTRHVSNPEYLSSQRSYSRLGFFGRKSAV